MKAIALVLVMIGLLMGCRSGRGTLDGLESALPGTTWGVEQIDDRPADHAAATLRFVSDTRVAGRAGCNQYAGALQLGTDTIRISEALSTRMACAPEVMEQEARFLAAATAARTFRRDGERLLLLDDAGRVRVRLAPLR
jgi:heat shock protein HslJ